jgi:hypothetical protein
VGLLSIPALKAGYNYVQRTRGVISDTKKAEMSKDSNYNEQFKSTTVENVLDAMEYLAVGSVVLPAAVEFIACTNIYGAGGSRALNHYSTNYSTNWFYLSTLTALSGTGRIRNALGTSKRNTEGYNVQKSATEVLKIVSVVIMNDPKELLNNALGLDISDQSFLNVVGGPLAGFYMAYLYRAQLKQVGSYVNKKMGGTAKLNNIKKMVSENPKAVSAATSFAAAVGSYVLTDIYTNVGIYWDQWSQGTGASVLLHNRLMDEGKYKDAEYIRRRHVADKFFKKAVRKHISKN